MDLKIRGKRNRITAALDKYNAKLRELQEECPHPSPEKTPKGSTGGWDPDRYWFEIRCHDCGKFWAEDQ